MQATKPPIQANENKTQTLRLLLFTLLTTSLLTPSLYQPILNTTWSYLLNNLIYKSSTFETFWTVFCYAAIEPFITYLFITHPEWRLSKPAPASKPNDATARTRPKGMRRPARRKLEALTYIVPLLTLDLTMVKKFADVPLAAKLESGNHDPDLALKHSGHFLLPSLHNFTADSPLQTQRALPTEAPSSRRIALELIVALLIYDTAFTAFHALLHLPPFRSLHAPHHTHTEMHPQITNQLSVFERLGLVLLANFALNIIGAHVFTRTLFVPLFVWLLVEIHSGMEGWWNLERVLPRGWAGGSGRHARHHAGVDGGGLGGVEPFFGVWEGVLGWVGG